MSGFRKESAIRNDEVSQCILNGSINSVYGFFPNFRQHTVFFFSTFLSSIFVATFFLQKVFAFILFEGLFSR